ncbi:MAG: hypothetical protein B2I17_08510 [Thermoplasmatales archaeon B_DKE]|nr:MAG: hypothetical protein B2I17_08510 [Thermoplasmatales archaeon B_DKE]
MAYSAGKIITVDARFNGSDMDFVFLAHSDHMGAMKASKSIIRCEAAAQLISAAYGIGPKLASDIPKTLSLLDSWHRLG